MQIQFIKIYNQIVNSMEKNTKQQENLINMVKNHNKNLTHLVHPSALKILNYSASYSIYGGKLNGQFSMISDDEIIYWVSNLLVIRNLRNHRQFFLSKEGRLRNVTAIKTTYRQDSKSQLQIIAGQSSLVQDKKACLTIITLKGDIAEWRILNMPHKGNFQTIQLCSSGRICSCLMLQQGSLIPIALVWKLNKDLIIIDHIFKGYEVNRLIMNPRNQKQLYTLNESNLKLWQVSQQKGLKQIGINILSTKKQSKQYSFVDCGWIFSNENACLVLLSKDRILLISNNQIKKNINVEQAELKVKKYNCLQKQIQKSLQQIYQMKQIFDEMLRENEKDFLVKDRDKDEKLQKKLELRCLLLSNTSAKLKNKQKHSLIIGANNGLLLFYELDSNFNVNHIITFQIDAQEQIKALYGTGPLTLISCVSQNQYNRSLNFNLVRTDLFDTEQSPIVNYFGNGCHLEKITSLSCAAMKEIFATSSLDKTVRVWTYKKYTQNKSLLTVSFKDEPLNVSIHPFGFTLAIAFRNEIKVFAILASQFLLLKSIKNLQECREVIFSNNGHLLITNQYSCLKIYDAVGLKLLFNFQLEQNRLWISRFYLTKDDTKLVCCYNNGSIYLWNLDLNGPKSKYVQNPCHVQPLGYKQFIYEKDYFLGCNQNKYMVIYTNKCKQLFTQFPIQDCTIQSLCISDNLNLLFAGTSKGSVRVYPWPIGQTTCALQIINPQLNRVKYVPPQFWQLHVHCRHICQLKMTQQNNYLIVGGDDGSLMLLDIAQSQFNHSGQKNKTIEITNNLFLMKTIDVQGKNQLIKKSQVDVLKAEQAIKKQRLKRQKEFDAAVERKKKQFQKLIEQETKLRDLNFSQQQMQISRLENEYQSKLAQFKALSLKSKQDHHKLKQYEQNRCKAIQAEIQQQKQIHKNKLKALLEKHREQVYKIKNQYRIKNQEVQNQYMSIIQQAKQFGDRELNQLEVIDLESPGDTEIINLKEDIKRLRQNNQILEKRNQDVANLYQQLKIKDQRVQCEFQELFQKHNQMRYRNLKTDEDIIKLQHQLIERLQVVDYKQEACKQAKQYQTNLQNFKFILDQRIRQLQKDKQVMIGTIRQKQIQLEKMFSQLIQQSQHNQTKEQELSGLERQVSTIQNEIRKSEVKIFFNMNRMHNYEKQLQQILQLDSKTKIAGRLSAMLQDNMQTAEPYLQKSKLSTNDIREIVKMRQQSGNHQNEQLLKYGSWMTKKLNLMKLTSKKIKNIKQDNINIVLRQNQKLIQECNLLRAENDAYDKQIKRASDFVESLTRKQHRFRILKQHSNKIMKLEKKLKDNAMQLQQQNNKLDTINQFVSSINNK